MRHPQRAALLAGLALATLVSASIGTASSRPVWIWPKSWAVTQLLKKFPGTSTQCDPVGPPTRQQGYNAYAEFACVVTLSAKSSYVLVIKPRSKAAWTTLRLEKTLSPSPPSPAPTGTIVHASGPLVGSSHLLSGKSLDGSHLTFDDGSRWLVSPAGEYQSVLWAVNDQVAVLKGTVPGYGYQLIDSSNGTSASARLLSR